DLVFIDLEDWDGAMAAARNIHGIASDTAIVGFGAGWVLGNEQQCHAAGIAELLISPVNLKSFEACVERAILKMRDASQENLFAFLSAKAGCGCSTVAMNLAGYLAGASVKGPVGNKVLVIEGDLHSAEFSLGLGAGNPNRWSVASSK